jgi:hypothetical protein
LQNGFRIAGAYHVEPSLNRVTGPDRVSRLEPKVMDHNTLRLFDSSTRTWTELGRFKIVHNPVWSRDERFLYFEVVDEASIYRARLSDRAMERVVGLDGVWRTGYEGCTFEGLAPDDSLLMSCFRYDTDIYALEWEMR